MKSRFVRALPAMTDPEPAPQPTPFPIRIIHDPVSSNTDDEKPAAGASNGKSRSDYFYSAWDKFLAVEPKRAKTTSTTLKKTLGEEQAVEQSPGDGLQVEENASKSWEEAAAECRAKVNAIVRECERLNQKYRDAIFDLEQNTYCLRSLSGHFPKVRAISSIPEFPSIDEYWITHFETGH